LQYSRRVSAAFKGEVATSTPNSICSKQHQNLNRLPIELGARRLPFTILSPDRVDFWLAVDTRVRVEQPVCATLTAFDPVVIDFFEMVAVTAVTAEPRPVKVLVTSDNSLLRLGVLQSGRKSCLSVG